MDYGQPNEMRNSSEIIKDSPNMADSWNDSPERDPRSIGDSAINSLRRNDEQGEQTSADARLGEIIEAELPPNISSGDINNADSAKIYEDASNLTAKMKFNSDGLNKAGINIMKKLERALDENDAAIYVESIRGDGGIQEKIMNDAYGANSALNELVKSSQTIKFPKNNQTNERKAA